MICFFRNLHQEVILIFLFGGRLHDAHPSVCMSVLLVEILGSHARGQVQASPREMQRRRRPVRSRRE